VEGAIDDNGNPIIDAETTEIVRQYAQRAIDLFTHKKEPPQQAPGLAGGEVPESLVKPGEKPMVNAWDSTTERDKAFDKIFEDNKDLLESVAGGSSET